MQEPCSGALLCHTLVQAGKLCGAEPRAAPLRRAKLSSDTDAIEIFLVTPQTPQGAAGGAPPPDSAGKAREREAAGASAAAGAPARTPPPLLKHEGKPRFPAGERRAARVAGWRPGLYRGCSCSRHVMRLPAQSSATALHR